MITPLDIENKKFSKRALNGYSTEEVDDFLDELTIDYEKLYKEVGEYKQTVDKQNVELEKYKQMESTLQNTLLMAQNAAEEIKNVARQQADAILNEAQTAARDQLTSIDTNMEAKQRELEELQRRIDEYKSQAEALLISQLELLKGNANNFNAI
ncbi:MAG: DivIVA domain-containing protein [Clostridia bacterium]|jgi:cell division initiation protein|nr:DivIVA domain-containing protein [Clostridia bacterium]